MSRDVGVGVVGYGYWGANLARNAQAATGIELVAIADLDEERRRRAARSHPGVTVASSLEDLLDNPAVEAVVLSTPAHVHAAMALKVISAGRHVLVEKPLAMNPGDAEAVVTAAAAAGVVAMVGHTFLYSRPVQRLREYVQDGTLGKVQYLYSQRLSLGRIRRDCNALWNFAPHDLSIMLYLLDDRPVEVSARGFAFIQHDIDDVCFASITFASGIGANLHVSWIDPRKTRLMTVVGDEKMVVYNDVSVDQKLWLVDAGVARADGEGFGAYESLGDFQWRTRAGDIVIPQIEMTEPLRAEVEAFGAACTSGEPPTTSARHGADVVRVLHAIDESAHANGTPVEVRW